MSRMSESNASYQAHSERSNSSAEDTSFAPYIQAFLAQTSRRYSCCNVMLPLPFERSAGKSWLNPKFDSHVLEEQYLISIFPQIRLRFRFALLYIICMTIIWLFYFSMRGIAIWSPLSYTLLFLVTISLLTLWITYTKFYKSNILICSGMYALLFIVTCLSLLYFSGSSLSILGHFAICVVCIICIYCVIPLPLFLCGIIAFVYSTGYEVLSYMLKDNSYFHDANVKFSVNVYKIIAIRILLHLCVHIISIHMLLMSMCRMRGTFIKVGQNLLVRRQLEMEKQLKEKMITSMMPKVVADMLLKEGTSIQPDQDLPNHHRPRHSSASDLKSMFRPFHMHSIQGVSILFADIVGFTKMSSKKTAEQLVEILNDLFERFDDLSLVHGCEKISTLGDCYYCVSGCPNAREDHAICCVEMGLGMIEAMKIFDSQRHEGIKMRVGIHTGNVLCGIVGTKRVKFDVWSNDVTFANKMESTGNPDLVHISEETKKFLGDAYMFREAEEVDGHRTYFILGKKNMMNPESDEFTEGNVRLNAELQIQAKKLKNLSTNDIPHMNILPTSPIQQSKSLSPSPILAVRKHRLASISGTVSKLLPFTTSSSSSKNTERQPLDCRKNPNPRIVIDERCISEVSISDEQRQQMYENGTNSESMLQKTNSCNNSKIINNYDCDNTNEKLVPYNEQNGYQQIPLIVAKNCDSDLSEISQTAVVLLSVKDAADGDDDSMNITDLRSYISQSRCDVSPFTRNNSHRSHTDRYQYNHQRSNSQQSNSLTPWYREGSLVPDYASLSPSRKDSGVRSNSRRSSIQQQLYYKNVLTNQNRVSGYFTSSQSSLYGVEGAGIGGADSVMMKHLPVPSPTNMMDLESRNGEDALKACVVHLRKQSDLQLIKCVRDNARSQRSYLVKPPLKKFSLYFESDAMEQNFRSKAHRHETENETGLATLATPKFNTFIDISVLSVIFLVIALSLFLLAPSIYSKAYKVWVVCFVVFSSLIFAVLFLCIKQICRKRTPRSSKYYNSIFGWASNWYPWHCIGSILISLPVASILINFAIVNAQQFPTIQFYYGLLLFVCLIHFCNFIQLNCWAKNILALVSGLMFVFIGYNHREISKALNSNYKQEFSKNFTINDKSMMRHDINIHWFDNFEVELCLDLMLVLILVFLLNREFEKGYRLSFYGNEVANQDKVRVQHMKNQADMLLHNIIPKHVAEVLKNTAKYSQNHRDVGIVFASIVNFTEMYDESYLGGKEYLRVLNELIGDFDELLLRDEFKCVEKIKTIGSTYMCASGLDSTYRSDAYEHLYALLDFAVAMQNAIDAFNRDLLEFNLVLRIGFNYGDVTAGVIGTTKLYYDIWGDAVNVASRMDSTGVPGRIQTRQDCISIFEDLYEFEPRGKVYVKGKDHMDVCLFKSKKPETLEVFQDNQIR